MKVYIFKSGHEKECFKNFEEAKNFAIEETEKYFRENFKDTCKYNGTSKRFDENSGVWTRIFFDDKRPGSNAYWADIYEYEVYEENHSSPSRCSFYLERELRKIDLIEHKKEMNKKDRQIIESYMKGETPKAVIDNISSSDGIIRF